MRLFALPTAVALSFCVLVTADRPASAQQVLSKVALTTSSPATSLDCPSTIKVTATAYGEANVSDTLRVSAVWDGAPPQALATPTLFTMPSGGVYTQSFSVDVPLKEGEGGQNYLRLEVDNPSTPAQIAYLNIACGKPTLVSAAAIAVSGGPWRPTTAIHYELEDLKVHVNVRVLAPDIHTAGCAYRVQLKNPEGKVEGEASEPATGIASEDAGKYYAASDVDLGTPQISGTYHLIVTSRNQAGVFPCAGEIDQALNINPQTAWVMGFDLVGYLESFGQSSSAGIPQFCKNCEHDPFSAPHESLFMAFNPTMKGETSDVSLAKCAYKLIFNGGPFSGNNSINLAQPVEVIYRNGDLGFPRNQWTVGGELPPQSQNPWWTQWSTGSSTYTDSSLASKAAVTLEPAGDPNVRDCNIADGGRISKSLSMGNKPNINSGTEDNIVNYP